MSQIKELLENFAANLYRGSREDCLKNHKCVKCKKDAIHFKDEKSAKEYPLSGWCQDCQDLFFKSSF